MNNKFKTNCGFFFIGALLGGAAVALTTPLTGRRMRRMVRDKIDAGADQLTKAAGDLRDSAQAVYSRGERILRPVIGH